MSWMWAIRQAIPRRAYWTLALAGLLIPLGGWAWLSASAGVDPVFLPGPLKVLERIHTWWTEDDLLGDTAISTLRVFLGWALSVVIAVPIGLFIGTRRTSSATISTIWKNEPRKMIAIFALSSMPTHSITSGTKATAGM